MCDCLDKVNKKFEPEGLALPVISMLNMTSGKARETVYMQTDRLKIGSRVKRKKVVPTYCPFCGEKAKAA